MKQTEYDFSVVRRIVSQFNTCGVFLSGLVDWEQALAGGQPCLSDNGVIGSTLELVGAIDRPRMLDRFQGYARAVLSDEDFAELVVKPQVNYDFEQVVLQADARTSSGCNTDLLVEILKLRDMVLASEWLDAPMSPEIADLLRFMTTLNRPRLSERLSRYCLLLIPIRR